MPLYGAEETLAALERGDSTAVLAMLDPEVSIYEAGHAETFEEYRSGHLASDIEFARSVERARWQAFPLGLSMVGEMVEGVIAAGAGIKTHDGSAVAGCGAYSNALAGILAGWGSAVSDCVASTNGDGVIVGGASTVIGCAVYVNAGDGIVVEESCLIANCTATGNEAGIRCGGGSVVRSCAGDGYAGAGQ